MIANPGRALLVCFVGSRALSTFGSWASGMVVVIWVRTLTGRDDAAALSMLLFALPTLAYPLIGQLIDRMDRLAALAASQAAGAAMISCFFLVDDRSDIWIVYVVQLLQGVNAGLISVAGDAMLPQLAPADRLSSVNGWLQSAMQAGRLAAPGTGVLIFTMSGGITAVIVFDIATFLVSLALLAPLARTARHRPARSEPESYIQALRHGTRLITGRPELRTVTLLNLGCGLAAGFLSSSWFAMITSGLGASPDFAGVLATSQAIGGMLGGPLGTWFAATHRIRGAGLCVTAAFCAVGPALLSGLAPLAVAGIALVGLGTSVLFVVYVTVVQNAVPEQLLGRSFATLDAYTNLAQVGGLAIGALWLGAMGSFQPIVVAAMVVLVPVALILLREGSARGEAAEVVAHALPAPASALRGALTVETPAVGGLHYRLRAHDGAGHRS
ncbi:MFS transporter [Nonomuraea angiospora]|uniref:MFS transporter n=1 Tax=Nonomuraea angiospora TaxID=46172 RepID=UPI0037ACAE75